MNWFASPKDLVLSLEIKGEALRAALVQVKKVPPFLALEHCSVKEGFGEAAETIRALLKQAGPRLKYSLLILGRDEVLLKNFLVPTVDAGEIQKAVEEKIEQQIPYEASEVVSDYKVTGKKDLESEILLVVAHRRVVDDKLALLEEVPLRPDRVLYSTEAILAACREQDIRWTASDRVLLIDVDQESSEIVHPQRDHWLLSKKVNAGRAKYEANEDAAFSDLFNEVEILFQGALYQAKGAVQRVLLSGSLPKTSPLVSKIKEYFGFEPRLLTLEGQETAPFSLTPLWGAAYAALLGSVNLLPEEVKEEKVQEEKVAEMNQLLQAGSAFLTGLLLLGLAHFGVQKFLLSNLENRVERLHPKIAAIEDIARGLGVRSENRKTQWILLETLATLHETLPPEVVLKRIDYDRSAGMTLLGTAKTNQQVTDFFKSLRRIPHAEKWALDYSQRAKRGEEEFFDFQIRFGLKGSPA